MNTIVIYKSKYGATKKYAEWIAERLLVELCDADGDFCDREAIGELIEYVR